jgi:hypothetical protein
MGGESYETFRRRARRAGQSLQAYVREQLITLAANPTKQEALEMIELAHAMDPRPGPTIESIVEAIKADRR